MPAVTLELVVMVAALALFVATEALMFTIATFLLLKALLLERRSALGRALGRNNLAMSLAYYSSFFSLWVSILRHPVWHAVVVSIVFATALTAILAFVKTYGGWRATAREAGDAAKGIVKEFTNNETHNSPFGLRFLDKIPHGYGKILILLVVLGVLVVLGALGALGAL